MQVRRENHSEPPPNPHDAAGSNRAAPPLLLLLPWHCCADDRCCLSRTAAAIQSAYHSVVEHRTKLDSHGGVHRFQKVCTCTKTVALHQLSPRLTEASDMLSARHERLCLIDMHIQVRLPAVTFDPERLCRPVVSRAQSCLVCSAFAVHDRDGCRARTICCC